MSSRSDAAKKAWVTRRGSSASSATLAAVQARIAARSKLAWKPQAAGAALKRYGRNGAKLPKGMGG